MRDEINLPEEKLDKEKANALEEKNGLLEHHNQMIDTNKNQLNRNNMFLLEKMRNMDEQIDWASIYARRICHNARQVGKDVHWYQQSMADVITQFWVIPQNSLFFKIKIKK